MSGYIYHAPWSPPSPSPPPLSSSSSAGACTSAAGGSCTSSGCCTPPSACVDTAAGEALCIPLAACVAESERRGEAWSCARRHRVCVRAAHSAQWHVPEGNIIIDEAISSAVKRWARDAEKKHALRLRFSVREWGEERLFNLPGAIKMGDPPPRWERTILGDERTCMAVSEEDARARRARAAAEAARRRLAAAAASHASRRTAMC